MTARRLDPALLLVAPAVLYLAVVYAVPLGLLLVKSVRTPDGFSLSSFVAFFADPFSWRVLGNTCLLYTSPSPRDRQKSRMPSSA